ncbi:hypothetical protein Hamer_G030801, partial [Homarus americanus]
VQVSLHQNPTIKRVTYQLESTESDHLSPTFRTGSEVYSGKDVFGPACLFVQWFQESRSSWGRTLALGPGISQLGSGGFFQEVNGFWTSMSRSQDPLGGEPWPSDLASARLGSGGFFQEVNGFWTSMLVCPVVPGVRILLGENPGPRTWHQPGSGTPHFFFLSLPSSFINWNGHCQ